MIEYFIKKIEQTDKMRLRFYISVFIGIILITGRNNILEILHSIGSIQIIGNFFKEAFWKVYFYFFFAIGIGQILEVRGVVNTLEKESESLAAETFIKTPEVISVENDMYNIEKKIINLKHLELTSEKEIKNITTHLITVFENYKDIKFKELEYPVPEMEKLYKKLNKNLINTFTIPIYILLSAVFFLVFFNIDVKTEYLMLYILFTYLVIICVGRKNITVMRNITDNVGNRLMLNSKDFEEKVERFEKIIDDINSKKSIINLKEGTG